MAPMGRRKIKVSSWFRNSVTEKTVLLLTEVGLLKLHVMMASRKREDFLMCKAWVSKHYCLCSVYK